MKSDLMVNLKEYFIKLEKEDDSFSAVEYYELIKQNKLMFKQILEQSESTEYNIDYNVIDEYSCEVMICFKYETSKIAYNLTFTSYGNSHNIDFTKCYKLGQFTLLDEEISDDVRIEWQGGSDAYKLKQIQDEIESKKQYILLQQRELVELEEQMSGL